MLLQESANRMHLPTLNIDENFLALLISFSLCKQHQHIMKHLQQSSFKLKTALFTAVSAAAGFHHAYHRPWGCSYCREHEKQRDGEP
jgi:hypothetical protein